jgi:hypothetical protein
MHSGVVVDLAHPDPDRIYLEDIAYHTAGIFRWTGGSRFTVAQHGVIVYHLSKTPWGLLHDAHEAYVGDVSHHLKRLLGPAYREISDAWEDAISERFDVPRTDVSYWDQLAAQLEANYMWPGQGVWVYRESILEASRAYPRIVPKAPETAASGWLRAAQWAGLR